MESKLLGIDLNRNCIKTVFAMKYLFLILLSKSLLYLIRALQEREIVSLFVSLEVGVMVKFRPVFIYFDLLKPIETQLNQIESQKRSIGVINTITCLTKEENLLWLKYIGNTFVVMRSGDFIWKVNPS